MIVTKHAKKRIRERLGLPKRAMLKHLNIVVRQGLWELAKDNHTFQITYNNFLYLFDYNRELDPILITTYKLNSLQRHNMSNDI
jgi:hypothetical protein